MTIPTWLHAMMESLESKSLDDPADRQAVMQAVAVGVRHERDQLVEQVATWLGQQGQGDHTPRELADMVRRGEWTS